MLLINISQIDNFYYIISFDDIVCKSIKISEIDADSIEINEGYQIDKTSLILVILILK